MREIKFRLRDRNNKIVGYEKWYEGAFKVDYCVAAPCWLYSVDNKKWAKQHILHRYKDPFTGLKDKNSKEIFEGDVINYSCAEYHDPEISCTPDVIDSGQGEIYYLKSAYEIKGAEFPPDCYELEIIGNIYENPDIYKSGSIRNAEKYEFLLYPRADPEQNKDRYASAWVEISERG